MKQNNILNETLFQFLQTITEPRRIAVLSEIITGKAKLIDIVKNTGLKPAEVQNAITKLEALGLVQNLNNEYVYLPETIKLLQAQLPKPQKESHFDSTTEPDVERKKVLHVYFRADESLVRFPLGDKKKKIVLDKIIQSFELGKLYSEKEINQTLAGFNSDYATLRRALIDFGYMDRKNGVYKMKNIVAE